MLFTVKHYIKYFCVLVYSILFSNVTILAQNTNTTSKVFPEPIFKHLTIDDGLSQNYPIAIEQDHNGFMWFGTMDGLNKYDGYSFTVYTHNPYDSTTISGNFITALMEDSRGILWIVTNYNEINLMDIKTELFRKISFNSPNISSITEDKQGNIWIGTLGGGLFSIEREDISKSDFQFRHYEHHPEEPNSLSDNNVRSIVVDDDGTLWIGTDSGLDKLLPDHTEKGFEHYFFGEGTNAQVNIIFSILNNSDSTLWLGASSGLIHFNRTTGDFLKYTHPQGVKLSGPLQIVQSSDDILWVAASGMYTFNIQKKKSGPYYQSPPIGNLFADKAGNIWMGSNAQGIYIYFPESNRFKSIPTNRYKNSRESSRSVYGLFEDSQHTLWFNIGASLFGWDRNTDIITSHPAVFNTPIVEDRNGFLWFDTMRGLCRFSLKTDEKPHFFPHPQNDHLVSGIIEDRSGSIWVVTNRYLSKLVDIQKSQFVSYQYNYGKVSGGTTMIIQDGQGDLWFTSNSGLIKFNQESEKFTFYTNDSADLNSIYSNITKSICPDPVSPEDKLWIGTAGGGLNLFDKRTETFTHILEKDGLPNNTVYGILPDEEGNLWLSTNRGISKYNPVSKQFTNYDINDGLQSNEFNTRAFFKSKSGEMFFGGINGLNYFYPQDIFKKDTTAKIVFTNFILFDKSVLVRDSNSILTKVISETEQIELTYKENQISFEFALLDYYAPAKNQFAYKLGGFNEDWIQLGTKRDVTFTNLEPGEYILKVKGSNSDGVWNENAASIKLIITPPFWATWWAYSFYVLFALGLLYSIRHYELNRTKLKNQVKLDEVKLKEREETDRMKSRFFANISHEFRTPLTLILGPSESIVTNSNEEETKKRAGMIKRNANRLLSLINQLLDLSKLEAGRLGLKASKSNIVSFVKGITMSFESLAEAKDITLKVMPEKERIELFFDKEKMTKIMTNVLSNAFKFTPEGGEITIKVGHAEFISASSFSSEIPIPMNSRWNDNMIIISVRDTGIGISEEEIPKLFDRFYQVDSSQTREHGGTGIGLALTKDLVELHRGTISVDSELSQWTEITIMFPLGKAHLKDEEIVDHQETEQPENVILSSTLNETKKLVAESEGSIDVETEEKTIILIVEDNADVREFIIDSLGGEYQLEEAANGEQGVRKAERIIPDLILSDIMMPKMDGNELTRILKNDEKTSHIPIILLTAKSEQESRLEGLETGADDYLTKPFDTKELLIRIKNLIELRLKLREKYIRGDYIPVKRDGQKKLSNLEENFMNKVMDVIEGHISEEEFSIEQFGKEVGMSRVQLHRKLKALSGKSASNYLRSVRLNKAKQMIKEQKGNISEIAYSVGFSSPAYFTRCFKAEFGFPPSDVSN